MLSHSPRRIVGQRVAGGLQIEERLPDPVPAGRAGDRDDQQHDADAPSSTPRRSHRAHGLPPPVGGPLQLDRAGPVPGRCVRITELGRAADPGQPLLLQLASVPSARSASTACVTHGVNGEPLSSTSPNCSGGPTAAAAGRRSSRRRSRPRSCRTPSAGRPRGRRSGRSAAPSWRRRCCCRPAACAVGLITR